MDRIKSSRDLSQQLNVAESVPPHNLGVVQQVVDRLMSQWPNNRGIYLQLQRLADFITKTRSELSSFRPQEMKEQFIPKAADELDAIVEATAAATHTIMDAADVIMDIAGRLEKADSDKAMAAVTSIYEACTFQDITGQRVTKVVNVLKVIEERIDKMVLALGELEPLDQAQIEALDLAAANPAFAPEAPAPSSGSALHGPALPGQGKSQAEIDAILSGLEGTP
ncbi:MAG: chemotaxis protein CheZ [Rhodospirillaceae bacterium]